MHKHVLKIDHEACWGCMTCEIACKQEHNAPDGIKYIRVVEDGPRETAGKLNFLYRVITCRHCEEPFCAEVCPAETISQRDDGVVLMDEKSCTGCEACVEACPYKAITFDRQRQIARKCNLCHERVDHGLLPACADNVCPAHGIYFGDPAEIEKVMGVKKKARNTAFA